MNEYKQWIAPAIIGAVIGYFAKDYIDPPRGCYPPYNQVSPTPPRNDPPRRDGPFRPAPGPDIPPR